MPQVIDRPKPAGFLKVALNSQDAKKAQDLSLTKNEQTGDLYTLEDICALLNAEPDCVRPRMVDPDTGKPFGFPDKEEPQLLGGDPQQVQALADKRASLLRDRESLDKERESLDKEREEFESEKAEFEKYKEEWYASEEDDDAKVQE